MPVSASRHERASLSTSPCGNSLVAFLGALNVKAKSTVTAHGFDTSFVVFCCASYATATAHGFSSVLGFMNTLPLARVMGLHDPLVRGRPGTKMSSVVTPTSSSAHTRHHGVRSALHQPTHAARGTSAGC